MSDHTHPEPRVRLVYRHSKPLTKLVVGVAVVLSLVTLLSLRSAQQHANDELFELWEQAQALEADNRQLELDTALLGTSQSTQKIAAEELGLVCPGTVFFQPEK